MTNPDKLRILLERQKLNQTEAARLLGVAPRTVRHWLAGDRAIPKLVWQFFRLLAATGYSARHALKLIG